MRSKLENMVNPETKKCGIQLKFILSYKSRKIGITSNTLTSSATLGGGGGRFLLAEKITFPGYIFDFLKRKSRLY